MKTTKRIASVIFAVVLMLIGSVLPRTTFAAPEPVDDPVYETDNYDASVYTIPAEIVSETFSLYDDQWNPITKSDSELSEIAALINENTIWYSNYGIAEYTQYILDYPEWGQRAFVIPKRNTIVVWTWETDTWYTYGINEGAMAELVGLCKPAVTYLEDVVTPIDEAYDYGVGWEEPSMLVSVDAEAIWHLLVPSAVSYGDIGNVPGYDFILSFNYSCTEELKKIETLKISLEASLVTFEVMYKYPAGDTSIAYQEIFNVPQDVMQQVIACCEFKEEACIPSVELTDEIVGEITYLARTAAFRIGRLTYDDIYNVVYQTGDYYQSALQIAATLDGSSLSTEQVLTYVGLAMRAQTWQEMRENLVSAIGCYAIEAFVAAEASCNDSFASQLVSDSFYAQWYEQEDVMTIVHYALWMSVVAGGCYC